MRRRQQGFTLIELMIVIAIVGILSAIAIPAYTDYILRSRITEAVSTLSGMRAKMEQYFQDNRSYAGAGSTSGAVTVASCPPDSTYFHYDCGTPTATGYTVTATGKGPMHDFVYTVDQAGNRASTGPTGWTPNPTCWLLKRDGSCS